MRRAPALQSPFEVVNALELDNIDTSAIKISSDALYTSLKCGMVLEGHNGCVNTLEWSEDGRLLASGSDDRKICLWAYPEGRLAGTLDTGHTQNIFNARFLPTGAERLITGAGDSQVKCIQIRDDTRMEVVQTWGCHQDRVKKIDVEPNNPHIFLTASEDGTVREFDMRSTGSQIVADWSDQNISLNSLSLAPLKPYLVAVGGTGPIIRLIDRRKPNTLCFTEPVWIPVQRGSDMVTAVRFRRNSLDLIASLINDGVHLVNVDGMFQGLYKGSSTYFQSEEHAYKELFKVWDRKEYESYYFAVSQVITRHRSLQYSCIAILQSVLAYEIYNRILCAVKLGHMEEAENDAWELVELNYGTFKDEEETIKTEAPVYSENNNVQDDEGNKISLLENTAVKLLAAVILSLPVNDKEDDGRVGRATFHEECMKFYKRKATVEDVNNMNPIDVPATDSWKILVSQQRVGIHSVRSWRQHVNVQTVKDVSFVGMRDEYIATGSDGGFFFIYDFTGQIIFMARSDTHIVNCIAENPRIPVLAVSGIDNGIKLWEPWGEEELLHSGIDERWRPVPIEIREEVLTSLRHSAGENLPVITVPCPVQ